METAECRAGIESEGVAECDWNRRGCVALLLWRRYCMNRVGIVLSIDNVSMRHDVEGQDIERSRDVRHSNL